MKKLILPFFLILSFLLSAQNFKFGKVSKQELEEKFHPIDSTASAAYLYNKRRTYYDYSNNDGFRIISEFHQRIKIYNKEGFDKANINMVYYKPDATGSREKITKVEAVTYNLENGKIKKSKISKKDVFEEQTNKFYARKKITLPNIKEGSVIELSYRLISPFITIIDDFDFQQDIPVNKLNYTVEIPEYYNYNQRTKGYYIVTPEFETGKRTILWQERSVNRVPGEFATKSMSTGSEDYKVNIQKYVAENIPAIKSNVPFVNNVANYRGGVTYEINYIKYPNQSPRYFSSGWNSVTKSIYEAIGPELNKNNYYKNDLAPLVQGATNPVEKIVKIFQFVKQKVKWNGYLGFYPNDPLKKTYKEGLGNVGAINLILTSMLRNAGVNANPVLVSTKNNGVPLFPTRKGFDYLVTAVSLEKGTLLLDASERYSVPNLLPSKALNWQGRLILKNGSSKWISLSSGTFSEEDNFMSFKILDDASLEGIVRTKFVNLGALEFRNKYNKVKEEQLISNFENDNSLEIENFKLSNKFNIGKPVVRTIKFSSEDLVEEISGKLYVNPLLFNAYSSNPFKEDERKFPIEFSSRWKEKNTVSIQIPEGYVIESKPETKALGLPDDLGLFKYQVLTQGNKIKIVSLLQFNRNKIPANYYEILKGFFGEFVEKQSEKIVLVKS